MFRVRTMTIRPVNASRASNLRGRAPRLVESDRFQKILVANSGADFIPFQADFPIDLFQGKQRCIVEPHANLRFPA